MYKERSILYVSTKRSIHDFSSMPLPSRYSFLNSCIVLNNSGRTKDKMDSNCFSILLFVLEPHL